jgi:uncharacterized protein (TIGR03083 family)
VADLRPWNETVAELLERGRSAGRRPEKRGYVLEMDLWPITIGARRSLLSAFGKLDEDQWSVRSLCEGWTIRELLAHLILAARPPVRRYIVAVARARGSFDQANQELATADARRPIGELLSEYRSVIEHCFSPPGWPPGAPLSDILLHSLDVRIPLGLETEQPPEHYEPVMELLFGRAGRSFTRAGRPAVRWTATDHEWSHGDGRIVSGTMADITLTAAGRGARLNRLEGDGVANLAAWLG